MEFFFWFCGFFYSFFFRLRLQGVVPNGTIDRWQMSYTHTRMRVSRHISHSVGVVWCQYTHSFIHSFTLTNSHSTIVYMRQCLLYNQHKTNGGVTRSTQPKMSLHWASNSRHYSTNRYVYVCVSVCVCVCCTFVQKHFHCTWGCSNVNA